MHFNEFCVATGLFGESPLCLLSVFLVFRSLHSTIFPTHTRWLKVKQNSAQKHHCHHHLLCMAYALAITMDATQPTAPSQSSELTLTRVMSPNDHSCPICTQSMGNEIWVCCRCYAYGHPGCIQITVVEGYTFCQQCAAWAKNEVERVKQQQQIVAWKETMQYQLEGWKRPQFSQRVP